MSKRIITISREFGSGGRTIGKEVAQKLGYSYYDKELVRQVAVETGFDEKYIEQAGEYAPSKNWLSFGFAARGPREPWRECPPMIFFGPFSAGSFGALRKKSLRHRGPVCDYILREQEDCLNVFIHASMAARADRIVRLYGSSEKSPEKRLEEKDKRRRVYYKHYTDGDWGMSQNYPLSLDSGIIGIQRCVDIISELAKTL